MSCTYHFPKGFDFARLQNDLPPGVTIHSTRSDLDCPCHCLKILGVRPETPVFCWAGKHRVFGVELELYGNNLDFELPILAIFSKHYDVRIMSEIGEWFDPDGTKFWIEES